MSEHAAIDAYGALTEPATFEDPAPAAGPHRARLGVSHRERLAPLSGWRRARWR